MADIKPFDITKPSATLADTMSNYARLATSINRSRNYGYGGGSTGKSSMGKGEYMYLQDPNDPTKMRTVFVPGSTASTREATLASMMNVEAANAIKNDKAIQSKLVGFDSLDVGRQRDVLADIRTNDINRVSKAYGVNSGELYKQMFSGLQEQVTATEQDLDDTGMLKTFWDKAKQTYYTAENYISMLGDTSEEKLDKAKTYLEKTQAITDSNPYLSNQDKMRSAGDSLYDVLSNEKSSLLTDVGGMVIEESADTGLELALPLIGGAIGGALGSFAPGPGNVIGATVGSSLGAGASALIGSLTGGQDAVLRIASDPNLTDEEKLAILESGTYAKGSALGAATAAVPFGVAKLAPKIAPKLAEKVATAATKSPVASSMLGASLGGAAINVPNVMGQNIIYEQSTGTETPITTGVTDALLQSLIFGSAAGGATGIARQAARNKISDDQEVQEQPTTTDTIEEDNLGGSEVEEVLNTLTQSTPIDTENLVQGAEYGTGSDTNQPITNVGGIIETTTVPISTDDIGADSGVETDTTTVIEPVAEQPIEDVSPTDADPQGRGISGGQDQADTTSVEDYGIATPTIATDAEVVDGRGSIGVTAQVDTTADTGAGSDTDRQSGSEISDRTNGDVSEVDGQPSFVNTKERNKLYSDFTSKLAEQLGVDPKTLRTNFTRYERILASGKTVDAKLSTFMDNVASKDKALYEQTLKLSEARRKKVTSSDMVAPVTSSITDEQANDLLEGVAPTVPMEQIISEQPTTLSTQAPMSVGDLELVYNNINPAITHKAKLAEFDGTLTKNNFNDFFSALHEDRVKPENLNIRVINSSIGGAKDLNAYNKNLVEVIGMDSFRDAYKAYSDWQDRLLIDAKMKRDIDIAEPNLANKVEVVTNRNKKVCI